MNGRKPIFYKYKINRHKSVSDEKFEIPKAAQFVLIYDCEDTVLKFIYELVDKFASHKSILISHEQNRTVRDIKEIIKELQDNDGYRFDFENGEEKSRALYGQLGVLLQHLWI